MRPQVLAGLLLLLARPLGAQTAEQLLTQAREAFENLDFERAAQLFTQVLDVSSGAAEAQRDTAQLYLGVSYEFAGQRANAVSAFRSLVRSNPCAPTPSQFGASVTAAFVEARGSVFAVGVCEIPLQRLARGDTAAFRVAVTQRALVRAVLQDSAGGTVADLGEQEALGISQLRWSQLPDPTTFGTLPVRYSLLVQARAQRGTEIAERSVPILIHAPPADTVAHPPEPPDSAFRPERRPAGPIAADLVKGLGVGAATAIASAAFAHGSLKGEAGKGLAVGVAVSLGGFVSFLVGNGRRDLPENRAHNLQLRGRWTAARDSAIAVNRERLSRRPLVVGPAEPR